MRPPEVEAAVKAALLLDEAEVVRRARIYDLKDVDSLRPECLVHLVRQARKVDRARFDTLFAILMERTAAMIAAVVRGTSQRSDDIRREVLDRFADKFIKDTDALDIFEVRFGRAFAALRVDVLRSFSSTPSTESLSLGEEDKPGAELAADANASPEHRLLLKETAQAAWRLPKELRKAIVLVYLLDYEIESTDPNKETAATKCGVSGRTIRTRLAEGLALLRKGMDEK